MNDPSRDRPDACAVGSADERTERHLRALKELAEIGMDLARAVRAQALDPAAEAPALGEAALVFSRIARAVRQTLALEARLAEAHETRGRRLEEEARRLRDEALPQARARKDTVRSAIELAIEGEAGVVDDAQESLLNDLYDRIEDEDDLVFADRPIGEHIARICRDLGITPDWTLWEDEDWALEEFDQRVRGSPYRWTPPDAPDAGPDDPDPPSADPLWPRPHPPDRQH